MAIYLDNSATTKIREEALAEYIRASRECYANPSSLHKMGYEAERALSAARAVILGTLKDKCGEVIFTASGSEANNLAIIGRALSKTRYLTSGAKIITTEGEHASVNAPLARLEAMGFRVVRIPTVGGKTDLDAMRHALDKSTVLVSMMMVNNETGALYDSVSVKNMMKELSPEAYLHIDATQSYLKIPFTRASCGADMITLSSHKIEGPKGVGALVLDKRILKEKGCSALILGGGQENGLRSGTENVPGACAFAKAAELAYAELDANLRHMNELRDYLIERLACDELSAISPTLPESHAPHILNITLPKIKSETMLHYLSSLGIYVSSGSACSSHSHGDASSALTAYGRSEADADSSIRISLSRHTEKEDIDALIKGLKDGLKRLARMK